MTQNARSLTRLRLGAAIVVGFLALVAARLCQVTLVEGDRLADLAHRQQFGREEVKPVRGAILDRDGQLLAISVDADSVFVRPRQLTPLPDAFAVARRLGLSEQQWIRKVSSGSPFVWLKRAASPVELETVRALDVQGIGTVPEARRFYPRGRLGSSVVGFAGIDSQGLEGVELAYNAYLQGTKAEIGVERDALGRKILAGGVEGGSRQGASVVLTLDSALQYVAERELNRRVAETRAKGGLVIVLDPHTGELLALAQNPSFDPNRLAGTPADDWRNRAVADVYEPGSTLKGLLAAAALEEGVASRRDRFFCENGRYAIGKRTIHDHHRHGWLSFDEVFRVSSNIGAAKIGQRLGARRYGRFLRAFGVGATTGIDLAGEQAGIIRPPERWTALDLATASFGHGVAVTPIQLAAAYSALANGGILMRPYVVRRVIAADGSVALENRPRIVRRVVSEQTAREITSILEGVVTAKGTAAAAAVPGVRVAGKTGTAQKVDFVHGGYAKGRIASFVGYLPADDPRMIVLVVLDDPTTTIWGGTAAAPVFRAVATASLERLGLHPDPTAAAGGAAAEKNASVASMERGEAPRESFLGLSLREALDLARRRNLGVEVVGAGYVVRQDPPPGRMSPDTASVRLELAPTGEPLT